jgi:hypothetical protein
MVAKVAHLPKTPQVKAVKAQVKMAHPHKEMVDKAMAILKAVKVKVMVAKVKAMAMAMVKATVTEIPKVTVMVTEIPMAEMKATHPKVAKKVLKKEIPIPIMRVESPPKKIQMREQQIQTPTKREKKATKVGILPKRAILTMTLLQQIAIPTRIMKAEIRAKMATVNPIVHHSLPKMKNPSIS